jgi:murein DD-endopeptidase MepM/ murein hydrolase activator NlpD
MAEKQFGPFGSTKPVGTNSGRFSWALKFLCVVACMTVIPLMLPNAKRAYNLVLERDLPNITVNALPPGIGQEPIEFTIDVEDLGSGMDEVIVRSEQGSEVRTLHSVKYKTRKKRDRITVSIDGRAQGFREGRVRISILVFDRSFWNSSIKRSFDLNVDYIAPQITVLSSQNYVRRGGVEMLFYRLNSDAEAFSGVSIGTSIFPGFPAKTLDPAFEVESDVYFSFFSVPLNFDESSDRVILLARDAVGNTSTASVPYRLRNLKTGKRDMLFDGNELDLITDRLFKEYLEFEEDRGSTVSDAIRARDTLLSRFETINKEFESTIEESLKQLMSRPKSKKYWSEAFGRPGGSRLPGGFGDTLTVKTKELNLGERISTGVSFSGGKEREVRAVNDGIVIFSDSLGFYGLCVIIDHGFGLTTVYTNLARSLKFEGDRVARGQRIAIAGRSGLANRTQVGLQFRLLGHPVRPEEWWDKNWINEHIDKKITKIKRQLGLSTRKSFNSR